MKRRWYESDPTLSMAISLLQNLLPAQQDWMLHDVMAYLSSEHLVLETHESLEGPLPIDTLLFFNRHRRWQRELWRILSYIKELPDQSRTEVALYMIDRMYLLDQGDFPEAAPEPDIAFGA